MHSGNWQIQGLGSQIQPLDFGTRTKSNPPRNALLRLPCGRAGAPRSVPGHHLLGPCVGATGDVVVITASSVAKVDTDWAKLMFAPEQPIAPTR